MSAIFISYTGRDLEGDAWADRLVEWFEEWNYGFFRDKDHSHGIKAGDDWRLTLYGELGDATAMVCLCSKQYDSSPWCVGEVAIAVNDGKTVIPIQLAKTAEDLKTEPLPLLLQTNQAIKVADAANPSPEQLSEVKQRLQATLQEKLNWRDLQHWDRKLAPYPGLPAFEEHQAPVFFGRDKAIEGVVERLASLAMRPKAFLLLLGASGYGKSSLVRAGVVPRLKGDSEGSWTLLPPFTPGDEPFKELENAVVDAGGVFDASDPLRSLQELQRKTRAPVVLVIDQFEELLTAGPKEEGKADQGEGFQEFLLALLRARKAGLMVLATMRTDFLAPLQTRWPALTGMASTYTLEPIEPEDFGELITGPANRATLTLESGLEARLVKESGGRDALPLLAFTLEKLWKARDGQVLTLNAYEALGGVAGAVRTRAKECWNPQTSSGEVRQAMREAFVGRLVSLTDEGRVAKRAAPMADLPLESREIMQRMVDDRLLVLKEGIVEIAHEALLRTWEPLMKWIEEGKEQLEEQRRVSRLCEELALEHPLAARLAALQGLLPLVEADPEAGTPAAEPVAAVLTEANRDPQEWLLAIRLLGLVGGEPSVAALSLFLEEQQLSEMVETERAAPVLEALCQAAAALQDIHRANPPGDDNDERWLLLPSAMVNDNGLAVRSQLVQLRLWATPSLHAPGAWFEHLGEGMAITMIAIPAGSFLMGSAPEEEAHEDSEHPQHIVKIQEFSIGQAPITQAQFQAIMNCNPSQFQEKNGYADNRPVELVSWNKAIEFCLLLREKTGRYYTLPSEAQWEYACRAGTSTPFHQGNTLISELANYNAGFTYGNGPEGNYRAQTTAVDMAPANLFGLQDMHGNVREWCMDEWHENFQSAPCDGMPWLYSPTAPACLAHVLKGGSWSAHPKFCRSALRHKVQQGYAYDSIGFRVACFL
jgi:formylglycine-generating enzyme required for sulfatase activity